MINTGISLYSVWVNQEIMTAIIRHFYVLGLTDNCQSNINSLYDLVRD